MANVYYTILINENHSFSHTKRAKIMYRSTGINTIRFLVNQMYGDLDMKKANVVLEIKTPISNKYKAIVLKASEELYKDRVEFLFPITIEYTKEIGNLEFTINFSYLDSDEDGNPVERVRTIGQTYIEVQDTTHWSDYIASDELDNIAQIMMTQQNLMEQQKDYLERIEELNETFVLEKADNIKYNKKDNSIQLESSGQVIGDKISLPECDCESGGSGGSSSGGGYDPDGFPTVDFTPTLTTSDDENDGKFDTVLF